MKLSLTTSVFLSALETAVHAASSKMPVLSCALVECKPDGTVQITCDSLDLRVSVAIADAKVDKAFSFVASPKMLKASLRADESTMTYDGKKLHVDSGGKSSFFTLDPTEFPREWGAITVKSIESAKFLSALKMVASCANPSDDLYNAALWNANHGHLFSIGSTASLCIQPFQLGVSDNFSLPQPSCRVIGSIFDADDSFAIGFNEGIIHIQERNIRMWSKTIEVKAPNVAALIINDEPFASFPREGLLKAFDMLEAFSDVNGDWATVKKDGDTWIVQSLNNEGESFVPVWGVEEVFEPRPFIVSRGRVSKFLRGLTADRVDVRVSAGDRPALMMTPCDETGTIGIFGLRRADA